jgi:hypothetical protein
MEFDVIIEWDNVVQRRLAEQGNEVSAHREKDEDDIEVEDECGGAGEWKAEADERTDTS